MFKGQIWNYSLLGNQMSDYAIAIAIIIIGYLSINILRLVIIKRLRRWSNKTVSQFDNRILDLIEGPLIKLSYLGIFYIALANLVLQPMLKQVLDVVCIIFATLLVIQLVCTLIEYGVRTYWIVRSSDSGTAQTLKAIMPAVRIVVWALGVIFLLDNLGFDISAIVAGIGIGGIAIALAAQGILQDLFSYFSILLDRPYEIGDFVIVGDLVGTVEHIGIKTTRIRSLGGEELIVANTDLVSSRIQNYKRMNRRRIVFHLGITYETSSEKLTTIPSLIKQAIDHTNHADFDRAHFLSYGDFSLNYEVVYFVDTNDYNIYMDAQQNINLALKSLFQDQGIEFAYPTQLLYIQNQINSNSNNELSSQDAIPLSNKQESAFGPA